MKKSGQKSTARSKSRNRSMRRRSKQREQLSEEATVSRGPAPETGAIRRCLPVPQTIQPFIVTVVPKIRPKLSFCEKIGIKTIPNRRTLKLLQDQEDEENSQSQHYRRVTQPAALQDRSLSPTLYNEQNYNVQGDQENVVRKARHHRRRSSRRLKHRASLEDSSFAQVPFVDPSYQNYEMDQYQENPAPKSHHQKLVKQRAPLGDRHFSRPCDDEPDVEGNPFITIALPIRKPDSNSLDDGSVCIQETPFPPTGFVYEYDPYPTWATPTYPVQSPDKEGVVRHYDPQPGLTTPWERNENRAKRREQACGQPVQIPISPDEYVPELENWFRVPGYRLMKLLRQIREADNFTTAATVGLSNTSLKLLDINEADYADAFRDRYNREPSSGDSVYEDIDTTPKKPRYTVNDCGSFIPAVDSPTKSMYNDSSPPQSERSFAVSPTRSLSTRVTGEANTSFTMYEDSPPRSKTCEVNAGFTVFEDSPPPSETSDVNAGFRVFEDSPPYSKTSEVHAGFTIFEDSPSRSETTDVNTGFTIYESPSRSETSEVNAHFTEYEVSPPLSETGEVDSNLGFYEDSLPQTDLASDEDGPPQNETGEVDNNLVFYEDGSPSQSELNFAACPAPDRRRLTKALRSRSHVRAIATMLLASWRPLTLDKVNQLLDIMTEEDAVEEKLVIARLKTNQEKRRTLLRECLLALADIDATRF